MVRGVQPSCLVTGVAGFIGCHLADRLVADGWIVAGIDDERTGSWSRVSPRVRRCDHDLTKLTEREMRNLLKGVDVLFHLAAEKHSQQNPADDRILDVNVAATSRLFRAAANAEVGKTIFTSSLYAYGSVGPEPMVETDLPNPITTYGVSKLAGEHLLRSIGTDHGGRWSVARLFFIYGPRQDVRSGYRTVIHANFERIRRGERPTVYGDGRQALDYVYIDDCIDALVALVDARHDGLTVNVASGRAAAVSDLTAAMLETAGSGVTPMTCPPDWTAGSVRVGSTALAREKLGWSATTELGDGLRRVWSRFLETT